MPSAAILSATLPSSDRPDLMRANLVFAAQTVIEYQARQAAYAGAESIFIMIDALTPALSRIVDRLSGEGLDVYLVRDVPGLIRQLPQESDILLFADAIIVDQRYVTEIGEMEGNALVVTPDDAATAGLERIDAANRWAGVARISPKKLFNTLDLIGDWDLTLTLLRAVVQSDPHRIVIPQNEVLDGKLGVIDRQETADVVSKTLSATDVGAQSLSGMERYLLHPVAHMAATRLLRQQMPADQLRMGAAGIAALGLALLLPGWHVAALLLLIVALAADMVAHHISAMTRMGPGSGLLRRLTPILVLAGIGWFAGVQESWKEAVYLLLPSGVILWTIERHKRKTLPPWAYATPGTILLVLIAGLVAGLAPLAIFIAIVAAMASLAAMLLSAQQLIQR